MATCGKRCKQEGRSNSDGCLGWEPALPNNPPSRNLPCDRIAARNRGSLALRAGRAYDKNLPFLEVFQSSKGEVMIATQKCG